MRVGPRMRSLRLTSRRLSSAAVAAAPGAAPAKKEPRGKLIPAMGAMSAAAATAAGATYLLSRTFVEDAGFREKLRREKGYISRWIEDDVLVNYAPSAWAQEVRIQDDVLSAPPVEEAGVPFEVLNVGSLHAAPPMTIFGQLAYGRFAGLDMADVYTQCGAVPADASEAAPMPTFGGGAVNPSPPLAAGAPTLMVGSGGDPALGPIAADDSEPGEPAGSLASALPPGGWVAGDPALSAKYYSGGPDGARYGAGAERDLQRWHAAWTMSPPPATLDRQLVPDRQGRHFDELLALYKSGVGAEAGGGGVEGSATAAGGRLISMPEGLRDEAHLAGAGSARRWQWLQLQEAYLEAEEAAVEASIEGMQQLAAQGEGGGIALLRMQARKRMLHSALLELNYEKRNV